MDVDVDCEIQASRVPGVAVSVAGKDLSQWAQWAAANDQLPAAVCGPLQYGAEIKAYALNLLIAQMLSLERVQQSLQTLLGQVISEATILKFVLLHVALERWEQRVIERLLTLHALDVDETSLRVSKENQ